MKLPPPGTPEAKYFLDRMLDDTGFFCRNVLGMNTDRDEFGNATGEIGKGGIRDHGPHAEVVKFLDDTTEPYRILWAPRFTYKSSMVTGLVLRLLLAHPDISILLCMHKASEAEARVKTIRDLLLSNEIIKEVFGNLRGSPWRNGAFVTARRLDKTLLTPSLYGGSPDRGLAGGRPNYVIFDDIVDETDVGSEKKLEKGIAFVENAIALSGRGTRYLMVCTPWDEADAGHHAVRSGWKQLTHLDIGFDVVPGKDGLLTLEGEQRWPHLTRDELMRRLRGGMRYEKFMSQFKLRVVRGLTTQFHRTQFQPEKWEDGRWKHLSGFLLTDTAPSGSTDGDLNVLMYVGVDERRHVYILDCEIGHWQMFEFVDRYLTMLQRWQSRVNHQREMWEKAPAYHPYMQLIRQQGEQRRIRLSPFAATRNQAAASKETRIALTAVLFQSRQVSVMDTVPATWNAGTEMRALWNPNGHVDPKTGIPMPGGDLVEQFVQFPHHKRKDIPDTFALIDTMDEETQRRVCCWARPADTGPSPETMRNLPNKDRGSRESSGWSASRFFERYS